MAKLKELSDIDDLSKKHFMDAIAAALNAHNGSILHLSVSLGLKSRCDAWVKGHMPPYGKMQEVYPKLLEISRKKEGA